MLRAAAWARSATQADLPAVLDLFEELRSAGPRGARIPPEPAATTKSEAEQRFREALFDRDARLLVAESDVHGERRIIGMTLCRVSSTGTFVDAPAVHMTHFFVHPSARRRGAGRVLVAAATAWAEQRGIDALAVAVYPHSREANRFVARLGFAPVYVHRVAPVSVLRRRLGAEVPAADVDAVGYGSPRRRMRAGVATRQLGLRRRFQV